MKNFLRLTALAICAIFMTANASAQDNYDATTMGNIVRYYETAKWAQGSPFNNQCWTDATQQTHAKTGCVPTAFAIIMRHHGFPVEGIGNLPNQQTGEVFTDRTYDYSKMPLTNASGWTTEQQNEVAKLMAHLGHAFGVTFGQGATSVSIGNTMSERMQKFFNYNYAPVSNQYAGSGQMYDFEEWKKNLKNSLDNGCPVPYAADNKKDGTNDSRHMFVIDGYTENEYFHFNFGWGGGSNGWYKLDDITPTGDDYSWRTTSDGYDSKHQAFFNLMPNTTTYAVTATVNDSNMGTVSINNGTAGSTATANLMQGVTATLTAHPAQGYALASWTKNGVVVGSRNTIQVTVGTDANDYVANFDDEANVYVIKDYIISPSTVGLTGSSKESVVNYQTSDEYPAALSLASTATNGTSLSAMSRISDDQIRLYAYDQATSSTTVKYTLSVPDGYQITEYKFDYSLNSTSYPCTITYSGGTISPNNTTWTSSPVIVNNAKTAEFTMSAEKANSSSNFYIKNFIVTVAKISSEGGGSTQTPTTYTINATAGAGGSVTINGEAVSQKNVNENSTVTVVATPQTGYSFVNWTSGTSTIVSTNATYSFTATGNTSLLANFAQATYTVNVEATEGGSAYIGTKGTTQATAAYNGNVTITAEANDGYEFVKWTDGEGYLFSTNASVQVSVTTDVTYTAVFRATDQAGTYPLAGKFFRIKVKNTTNYMNIANTSNNTGSTSGVTVVAKNESSDTQIFLFEQSSDGYKLKANSGNYIKCHAWNANANTTSASDATVLTFEPTANELEYLIKWDNTNMNQGVERDDYFKAENGYVFCDAAIGSATTWVLEEVIPSNEKTLDVTFNNATYTKTDGTELTSGWGYQVVTQTTPAVTIKVAETINNFGYTTGVISGVKTPYLYKNTNFILSISEQYKITGYRITVRGQDNSYSGDFTCSVDGNETSKATLSGTTTQTLSATDLDTNIINISVGGTSGNGIFITALEITYIENEFTPLPFKAEIENWRNDNPNTHLGTITVGGTAMKLTPAHQTASELTMPVVEGTTLAFTRKYRGFEFNGFYIGATELGTNPTLTAANVAAIDENNPLIAKFTATDDVTLFYDDDTYSYRIPAIAKTGNGMLVAVTDYRHNHDDIGRDNHGTGTKRIDLVMRTSTDNGATWSETKTIAAGDNNQVGSWLRAFGDAAIASYRDSILVMAAAGDVVYTDGTTSSPNKMARIYSTDNGENWAKEEMTTKMYSQSTSLIPSGGSAFFGSGKLAVDENFNGTGKPRVYGALLVRIGTDGYNNFGIFSDDWGATWKILGGDNANPVAKGDEPKVEILPNGQILLSARRGGGRVFNVFTYGDDKANGAGTWSVDAQNAVNGCDNGGSNATNGEIICLDAKKPNGKPTKILLQSQPKGGSNQYDRKNVTIWYKEVSADETYTAASIASGWTQGIEVCPTDIKSAYSAMCLQENGEIAFFFEEAPCHNDDHTYGYSMVYVPLTIEEITGENFLNPNAVVETVTVDVTLTDAQGNTYTHQFDYLPGDAAAINAALMTAYPFITELGVGNLQGSDTYYTYTNTVTLPFKVSNANTTVWHNIYFPANGTSAGEYYPIYLMAENENATAVAKITEKVHYGNSQYNTYNYADKLAWAVYNVNDGFTFKFKNKLTGKFMAVTGVSSDNTNNVVYTDEAGATAFTLEKYTGGNASYGNYAIKSVYNSTTGYVCNTSVGYTYATNYPGTGHAGAWVKFVESPDYWTIYNQLIADIDNFGAGEGKYTANDAISSIDKDALATMPINSLNTQKENVQTVKDSYREITLTVPEVNDVVPGSVSIAGEPVNNKFVPAGSVRIEAFPAAGYRFVNWTRPAAQASAAARTAEARNSNVVSDQNPYTVTVSEALNLEANFEKKVINVTLTDNTNSNNQNPYVFEFVLDDLEGEVTTAAIANKLMEKYPVIKSVGEGNSATLTDNGTSYTYTNTVKLPFEVANGKEDDAVIWYNIYYPANLENKPNYLSASTNETTLVEKINDDTFAYGDNPTYNTESGNNPISWAIYSVDKSLTFTLKNKVTGKYIQVTGVATNSDNNGKVQNAVFADETNATAFTFARKTESFIDYFAFEAEIDGTTGYLCSTASSYGWATHYNSNDHRGGWARIEDPAYYTRYFDLSMGLYMWFHEGNGFCTVTSEIQAIEDALANYETITLNTFRQYGITIARADSLWPTLNISINPEIGGFTAINGEEGVTTKRAPADYELPIAAVPAEGYHFVNWTKGDDVLSSNAEHAVTISGVKGDVTELTANFAINTYTVSVTAGEGGSATASAATVEHGSEVILTATPNDGYEFVNWTKGTDVVSTNAIYTFTATADGEYVANFELANTPAKYYTVRIETEGLSNDKFAAYINTGTTQNETAKDYEPGSTVRLIAIQDNSDVGSYDYAFEGWYLNGTLVSINEEIEFNITSNVTYTAKFVEGIRISTRAERGWPHIYLYESDKEVGGTSMSTILVPGRRLKLSVTPEYGCRFTHWVVGDEVVSTDNPFTTEPLNEAVTFKAICEPAYYNLTVRSNSDTAGKVTVNSNESSSEMTVKIGHNTEATITAIPNDGFKFVNWTKGTDVVSTNATYTIAAIDAIENLKDVEYIANFIEAEEAEPGVYYRFAYEFPAAAAASAARAGATRAAGDTQTITPITTGTLSNKSNSKYTQWNGENDILTIHATGGNGNTPVYAIYKSLDYFRLFGYTNDENAVTYNSVKYTLSAKEGYVITNCSFSYTQKIAGAVTINCNGASENYNDTSSHNWAITPNTQTVEITLSTTTNNSSNYLTVKNFTVTIQQVGGGEGEGEGGGEIPEPEPEPEPETPSTVKYYIQSVASNVSGKTNALLMTQETGASSIFYYADSKLLSYDKGTYVKEDGGTRGLQAVGTSGTVTITTTGETSTIAAPSYMHANSVTSGTNTTYFIDHCGSNPDNHAASHNFVLEEVTTLPVTISAALHATFYAPVAVAIPDGVTAYVLKAEDIPGIETYAWMTSLKNGIIPANTGVILKAAEGTYDFDIVGDDIDNYDEARTEAVGNVLSGTVAKTNITQDAYILTKKNNVVGMYPLAKNSYLENSTTTPTTVRFTNNSHKAYLPVTDDWFGEQLKKGTGFRFVYDDEETTDIEEAETEVEDTIYDLHGRKLSEITEPGFYIVNGKKIFVK